MNRRTLIIVTTGVALIAFGCITTFVIFPVNVESLDREFEPHTADEFEVTGAFPTGSERYVEYKGAVDANGTAYFHKRSSEGSGYVSERYEDDMAIYIRIETNRTETYFADREQRLYGGDIIEQKEQGDRVVTIIYANESDRTVEESIRTQGQIINRVLGQAAYNNVEDTNTNTVIVPKNGWYSHKDISANYRITEAAGKIQIDPESDTVLRADVEFERTIGGSHLAYLLNRDNAFQIELVYDVETGPTTVDTPGWVDEIRSSE